jgi:hypothetical protein
MDRISACAVVGWQSCQRLGPVWPGRHSSAVAHTWGLGDPAGGSPPGSGRLPSQASWSFVTGSWIAAGGLRCPGLMRDDAEDAAGAAAVLDDRIGLAALESCQVGALAIC